MADVQLINRHTATPGHLTLKCSFILTRELAMRKMSVKYRELAMRKMSVKYRYPDF